MFRSSFVQERTAITTEPRTTKDRTPDIHRIALYLDEQYCVGNANSTGYTKTRGKNSLIGLNVGTCQF